MEDGTVNSVDSGVRDPKKSLFYFLALVSRPVPENKNAQKIKAVRAVPRCRAVAVAPFCLARRLVYLPE